MRIGVSIFSYDGTVTFGVTGDREVSADVGALAAGIDDAIAEMLALATGTVPAAGA
jgi:hypothetical protein